MVIAERVLAMSDLVLVAAWFGVVGHPDWAAAVVAAGLVATPLFLRTPARVPITVVQAIWLVGTSLIAVQFASTGVGAAAGYVVWSFGYLAWALYRLKERTIERRAAAFDLAQVTPADAAVWPIVVRYPPGRALAFRGAFAFFVLTFLSGLWLLAGEFLRSAPGLGLVVGLWHLAVLWFLLAAGSRAVDRIVLNRDRIELTRVVGRARIVHFAEVSEVRILRWSPQGLRTAQLEFLDVTARAVASLDLGDARQRSLLPLIRGRLGFVAWRSERRTSWL